MRNSENKKAFTLAETLITLTILGVVAAITVPSLINKYIESSNRTKVKKSMAAYEKALNQMIIENDLKSGDAIKAFGEVVIDGLGCANTRPYFKAIESVTGNNCRFKTADRVWWDITDIQHPIIMLNDDNKEIALTGENGLQTKAKGDDKTVYGMVGTIDDGVVRINDKGVAEGDDAKLLNKTYAFMNNEQSSATIDGGSQLDPLQFCMDSGESTCAKDGGIPYTKIPKGTISPVLYCTYFNGEENCNNQSTSNIEGDNIYVSASSENYILFNDAETLCSENSGRLPTIAELKSMQSSGTLPHCANDQFGCYFWASDVVGMENIAYYVKEDGSYNPNGKDASYFHAICIAN